MIFIEELNNREIAIIIWIVAFFIWALTNSNVRISIINLLKVFFQKKIQILFIAMIAYIVYIILILSKINFWDFSALKDTIIWFFGTALVTFFALNKALQNDDYFKQVVLDNVKFAVVLEFIVNIYTFSLPIEIIIVPVIIFLAIMSSFLENKPKEKQVKSFVDSILGIIGLFLLSFTIREVVVDFHNFVSLKNLRDFLLPPVLSIMLIPYLYFTALFMQYEHFFLLIGFANKDNNFSWKIKKTVFRTCHLNLTKLKRITKKAGYPEINQIEDIAEWFKG